MAENKPFCISKWAVFSAWALVRDNRGAAGVDGVSIEGFEGKLKNNLYRIWNRMSSGSYVPPPVRRVLIPKAGGGDRPLGIPTVGDRVAQTVVKIDLERQVEHLFHPDSYGYNAINAEVRNWNLHRMNDKEMEDLSRQFNRTIRGWVNYYGKYYPSALRRTFRSLNGRLVSWAQRKYRRLRDHLGEATRWLSRLAKQHRTQFAHWEIGIVP